MDGHSLLHRAFYALPTLTSSQGEYTNAILGFTMMLMRLIEDEEPDFLAVAFDEAAPTFRHRQFDDYKAHRKPMPEELRPQVDGVREVVDGFNIPILSLAGYEADDVIGTAAVKAEAAGYLTYIVTGDRDSLQLVNENIHALITRRGIRDLEHYDPQKVVEEYGVTPAQFAELKGLMGDKSDNIPGVPGIGPKTAARLLQSYGSIGGIYEHIDDLKGKQRENLITHKEQAQLSLQLAIIDCDVPIDIDFSRYRANDWNLEKLRDLFVRYEFRQLLDKLVAKFPNEGLDPRTQEPAVGESDDSAQLSLGFGEEEVAWKFEVASSLEAARNLLDKVGTTKELLIDLYLDGADAMSGQVSAIALGVAGESILVCLDNKLQSNYNLPEGDLVQLLEPVLVDESVTKVGYDLKPLAVWCLRVGGFTPQGLFDTALAGYLCNPSQSSKQLEDLVMQYFDEYVPPLTELTGTGARAKAFADLDPSQLAEFALRRLKHLTLLQERLTDQLTQDDLLELFAQLETPLISVLAKMEWRGVRVNTEELKFISAEFGQRVEQLTEEIYQLAGEEFNINSPKQLGQILFDKLGLPVLKKTKSGPSTSAEVLEQLAEENEIVAKILDYRQLVKLKSTYVDALGPLVNPRTGRIHTSFNQMVTATGRLSSTNPNLQNIPVRTEEGRRIRAAFTGRR